MWRYRGADGVVPAIPWVFVTSVGTRPSPILMNWLSEASETGRKIIDKPVDRVLLVPYFAGSHWTVNRPKIVSPLALRESKGGGNGVLSLFGIRLDFGLGRRPCSSVGRARPW